MKEMIVIRELLKTKHHNSIFTLSKPLTCNYTIELDGIVYQAVTKVKYVFVKDNIPFVADEKWDEVAMDCLNKNQVERIVGVLAN